MTLFDGINAAVEALFSIPNIALWLAFGLLAWCGGIILANRRRHFHPLIHRLDERLAATDFVAAADSEVAARTAFAEDFAQVDAAMMAGGAQAGALRHAWSQFRGGLLDPEETPLRATAAPGDDFGAIGDEVRGLAWWANIFVAIGLSFTFLGIVAALLAAVRAMGASADPATMQVALVGLLHITAAKFWTSIGGVLSSIILRVFDRRWSAAVERRLDALCERLERGTVFTTPQQLAYAQLRLVEEGLHRDEARPRGGRAASEIEGLVADLLGRMHALEAERNALAARGSGAGGEEIGAAARELREAAALMVEALGSAGQAQTRAARAADAGATTLVDAAAEVGTMLGTLARVASEMAGIAAPLRDGVQRLASAASAVEDAARLLERRGARADETIGTIAASLEQTSASAGRAFEAYRDRFDAVDVSLAQALDAIGSASADHAAALTAQVGQIDSAMGSAVDRLATSLAVIGDLAAALDDMRGEMRVRR